jgi:hypothetical protein
MSLAIETSTTPPVITTAFRAAFHTRTTRLRISTMTDGRPHEQPAPQPAGQQPCQTAHLRGGDVFLLGHVAERIVVPEIRSG